MPDPVPAAAAPAAAAPSPEAQPSAAAATPPPTPPISESKKLSGRLFELLTTPTDDTTDPAKKKEEPKPAAAPAPEPPKPAPATEKPIKVTKKKPPEETPPPVPSKKDLAPSATSAGAPAPAPVAKTPAEIDAEFEKELVDEERALLDDARAAEKYGGEKYKGHAAKMTAFLRENTKKSEAMEKGELDQAEYEKWHAANVPKIAPLDFRNIERARVTADVTKDFEPKLEAERHTRWTEGEAPKVKAKGDAIYNRLIKDALPDEFAAAIAERTKGITDPVKYREAVQAVEKDYALEAEITTNVVNAATSDLEEFHRLTTAHPTTGKTLVEFDPNNPQHNRVLQIVTDLCADFKATGGAELKNKEGKWFVTREEWHGMTPEQRKPFWTFSNDQLIERAGAKVKGAVTASVKAQHQMLEARGFKRTIAAPAAAAAAPTPPAAGAPPAPRPTPPPPSNQPGAPSIGASLAKTLTSQPSE